MDFNLVGLELIDSRCAQDIERAIELIVSATELAGHTVNIALVDDDTMYSLCENFKGRKYLTDVLSFPMHEEESGFLGPKDHLGDVVICVSKAMEQAAEYGHSLKEEIAVLCAHGLFHLMGYDHEVSEEEANIQMQAEMYLLEKANFCPELSLIGRV